MLRVQTHNTGTAGGQSLHNTSIRTSNTKLIRISESDYVSRCACGHGVNISAYRSLKTDLGYWRNQYKKLLLREKAQKKQIESLKAKLRLREKQLFAERSEKRSAKCEANTTKTEKRPRGHQKGAPGHGRQANEQLPVREEILDIPESERFCSSCGLPFEEFPGTEDSEILEVEVAAHKRIIKRKRYKKTCKCKQRIIVAPTAGRLIPKGKLGVSIWVNVLLDKFCHYNPTHRTLKTLRDHGLTISQGTVTNGLKRITSLFDPVYEEICEYNRQEKHWHADETCWKVFEEKEGKIGYRWYLWVFKSKYSVTFIIDPGRSAQVVKDHLRKSEGIISCDRYSAYKAFAKQASILLAFCWAHVRRDFIEHAKSWPKQECWAMGWVKSIGNLYHLNNHRLCLESDAEEYQKTEAELKKVINEVGKNLHEELASDLYIQSKKVLESLKNHWSGLTIFVNSPSIPMDNNKAENSLRGPVVGRKGFYGSGCIWSGKLAAQQFSILQTLRLWDINLYNWMTRFLTACANNNGKLPSDWENNFLPWKMDSERLNVLKKVLNNTT